MRVVFLVIHKQGFPRFQHEATGNKYLASTQEEIARDVNSAREVVARMLGHFSSEGLVDVKRGHVLLKDLQGIQQLQQLFFAKCDLLTDSASKQT